VLATCSSRPLGPFAFQWLFGGWDDLVGSFPLALLPMIFLLSYGNLSGNLATPLILNPSPDLSAGTFNDLAYF
jgi:hypothetical protein